MLESDEGLKGLRKSFKPQKCQSVASQTHSDGRSSLRIKMLLALLTLCYLTKFMSAQVPLASKTVHPSAVFDLSCFAS